MSEEKRKRRPHGSKQRSRLDERTWNARRANEQSSRLHALISGAGKFAGWIAAALVGLAILSAQVLHGGRDFTVYSIPSYGMLGAAAVIGLIVVLSRWQSRTPVVAIGTIIVTAAYFWWRVATSGNDAYWPHFYTLLLLGWLAAYALMAGVITHPAQRTAVFAILMAGAFAQSSVEVIQLISRREIAILPWLHDVFPRPYPISFDGRARGFFTNPNHFAWAMSTIGMFSLSFAIWGRWHVIGKVIAGYIALASFAAAVASLSRAGIVAMACGAGVLVLLSIGVLFSGASGRKSLAIMAGLLVLLGGGGYLLWLLGGQSLLLERLAGLDGSFADRMHMWSIAVRQFESFPWLGEGTGSYIYVMRNHPPPSLHGPDIDYQYVHNDWLQSAAEYGLIGLALLLLVGAIHWLLALRSTFSIAKALRADGRPLQSTGLALSIGACATLAAYAVHSVFDFNLHIPANSLLAAVVFGVAARGGRENAPGIAGGAVRSVFLACLLLVSGLLLLLKVVHTGQSEIEALVALEALKKNEVEKASSHSRTALRLWPDNMLAMETAGLAAYSEATATSEEPKRTNLLREAERNFARLAAERPKSFEGSFRLGQTQMQMNDLSAAERTFQDAYQRAPMRTIMMENLAIVALRERQPDLAEACARSALYRPGAAFLLQTSTMLRETMEVVPAPPAAEPQFR